MTEQETHKAKMRIYMRINSRLAKRKVSMRDLSTWLITNGFRPVVKQNSLDQMKRLDVEIRKIYPDLPKQNGNKGAW